MRTNGRIQHIVSQHAEEAAFLWTLRRGAALAPHFRLAGLADLDERVAAHLDGLVIAGEEGLAMVRGHLGPDTPGEAFATAAVALALRDRGGLEAALKIAEESAPAWAGVASAFGWAEPDRLRGLALDLLADPVPARRAIGVATCVMHRADPGARLDDLLADPDPRVRAWSLRAAGVLKRRDLKPQLGPAGDDEDEACRFRAAWAAGLMGEASAAGRLRAVAESGGRGARDATGLAVRLMDAMASRQWISMLARNEETMITAIRAASALGDPMIVRWLLPLTAKPPVARAAGEAIAWIAGIDLADEDLDRPAPEGADTLPNDDPEDDRVALDEDEALPWPDPRLVADWWRQHEGGFANGVRHLCGKPIDGPQLQTVLRSGNQRQRAAAAMELALLHPKEKLFETRAPGFRQRRLLGL